MNLPKIFARAPLTERPPDAVSEHDDTWSDDRSRLDLSALLEVLFRRKKVIFGAMIVTLGVVVGALIVMPRIYYANAIVMLDQRRNSIEGINSVLSGLPTDPASIQNQIQILTSRELASRVVHKLALDRDPEFNALLSGGALNLFGFAVPVRTASKPIVDGVAEALAEAERKKSARVGASNPVLDAVIMRLLARVTAQPLGASTAISITVGSEDATKAALLTNALAEAYVDDQLKVKSEATQKAVQWLSERAQMLAMQVQAAESAVQQYKVEHGITGTAGGGSTIDQQIINLNNQLSIANADLAQKEAIYNRVVQLKNAGRAPDVTQTVGSQLIIQLRNQEAELGRQEAQLGSRYLADHPKMLDIKSQRLGIAEKIRIEVERVVESVANDVAVARASVASLQRSLTQIEHRVQTQNSASTGLTALESAAASSRSMYEALLSRLKEIQGQEDIATPDARVLSRATIPLSPSPSTSIVIAMAVPVSLMLGLFLAFLLERIEMGLDPRDPIRLSTDDDANSSGDLRTALAHSRAPHSRMLEPPAYNGPVAVRPRERFAREW
jgi:uncharacterized protein involved in exopolysaccharide biosynthesis